MIQQTRYNNEQDRQQRRKLQDCEAARGLKLRENTMGFDL